jgi:hypothetical protein
MNNLNKNKSKKEKGVIESYEDYLYKEISHNKIIVVLILSGSLLYLLMGVFI